MYRIPSEKPRTRPALEAKTYPDLYITSLRLGYTRAGTQPLKVTFRPYNFDTKELDPDLTHEITDTTGNIWEKAAQFSAVAEAIGSLVSVLGLMHREKYLAERLEDGDESVLDELKTVRAELGER